MRVLFLILIGLSFLTANSIKWVHSLDKAINLAKKEHKNIMVFVDANGCPYCEKMKNETLSDKDVVRNLNKDFINVELKIDSQDVRENFPQTAVTPTIYFITPQKQLLNQIVGFENVEFFFWDLAEVDRALEKLKKENK